MTIPDSDSSSSKHKTAKVPVVNEIIHNHYINRVHYVRKFDFRLLRNMQRTAARFMYEGKKEFGVQLKKWEDLFEEATEDIYELQD